MRRSALGLLAVALLLGGCEGVTEPPYPSDNEEEEQEKPPPQTALIVEPDFSEAGFA